MKEIVKLYLDKKIREKERKIGKLRKHIEELKKNLPKDLVLIESEDQDIVKDYHMYTTFLDDPITEYYEFVEKIGNTFQLHAIRNDEKLFTAVQEQYEISCNEILEKLDPMIREEFNNDIKNLI